MSWEGSDAARADSENADAEGAPSARTAAEGTAPESTGGASDDVAPGDDPLPSVGSLRWAPDVTAQVPAVVDGTVDGALDGALGGALGEAVDEGADEWVGGGTGWDSDASPPEPGGFPPALAGPPSSPAYLEPAEQVAPPGHVSARRTGSTPRVAGPPGRSDQAPSGGGAHRPASGPDGSPPGSGARAAPPDAEHPPGGPVRSQRAEAVVLAAIGVVVVVVGVVAMAIDRDSSAQSEDAPVEESAPVVPGDSTAPAGPIVGPTGVIGSWSGAEWVPRPDGDQQGAGLDFQVVGLEGQIGSEPGISVAEECRAERGSTERDVAIGLTPDGGDGPAPIAVAGVARPRPRGVETYPTEAEVYVRAASEVANGLGATSSPTLTQVLRADVDGDGTDEVVVAAEHLADPEGLRAAAGDWSVVFYRRVAGDGVDTTVLSSSVAPAATSSATGAGGAGASDEPLIERIQVASIADFNNDGTMEVALAGRSSTGEWTSVHALDGDGVPVEVLRAGCES